MKIYRMIVTLILLWGLGLAFAPVKPALATGGAISGVVTDEQGNPLDNIWVAVFAYTPQSSTIPWTGVYRVMTDVNGFYDLPGLDLGTYRIGFFDNRAPRQYLTEYYDNGTDIGSATDVIVASNTIVAGINAQLPAGSHITGQVTDLAGNSLSNIRVQAWVLGTEPPNNFWYAAYGTITDATGAYDLPGLDPGVYRIHFVDNRLSQEYIFEFYNDAITVESATDVIVAPSTTVSNINAQLAANTAHITGHVTDLAGNPVEGVRAAAYQYNPELAGWFSQAWTDTDANGNYELGGLAAGVYRVEFVDATFVRYLTEYYDNATTVESAQDIIVNAGETVSDIDAALALLGHVTGRVTDRKGNPLADIQVTAYRYTPFMGGWYDYSFAITDANGNYDLRGFEPGSYRVRFIDGAGRYATQFYKNARDIDHARDIAVTQSEIVTGIDAKLKSAQGAKEEDGADEALSEAVQANFLYLPLASQ